MTESAQTATAVHNATSVSPTKAAELVRAGRAWIVDVREPDEFRREHLTGSALCPTSLMSADEFPPARSGLDTLVLCRSGTRAGRAVMALRAGGRTDAFTIEGGITAWAKAGLPVEHNVRAPLPIMRQVMLTVGTLVLVLTALAAFVSPWWLIGIGAMAAGLVFSGATGLCGMAAVLSRAPWNARAAHCAKPKSA